MVLWSQLWWKLWWKLRFCRERENRAKFFSWQNSLGPLGLPCHTRFSILKCCIFLWTLLDCLTIMEINFEPFWVWANMTSVAAEPRNGLEACMLHFPGHRARSWALQTSVLGHKKLSALLATLQQYLRALVTACVAAGIQEDAAFVLRFTRKHHASCNE